jgi:hypothetical protein
MALGLNRLGQALPAVRGLTAAGDIRRVLAANVQAVIDAVGETAAESTADQIRQQQEARRTWFQQTFYVSRRQLAQEQEEIRKGARDAGALASVVTGATMQGIQWGLGRWDLRGSARIIRRVIGAAAAGPDGQLTEAGEVILLGAVDGFGLSARARVRLNAEPLPRSVRELQGCALQEPLLSAVAAIAFSAMAAATDTGDARRRMPHLLLRLGMPQPTAEAATHTAMNEYLSARMLLTDHYRILQSAVAGTALQLRLPRAHIVAATERVIACNPYEEARKANRRDLAKCVANGARLAALLHSGTPIGPAMSIAVGALGHVIPRQAPTPAPQLTAAFQAYATANGLPQEQVQIWARGAFG